MIHDLSPIAIKEFQWGDRFFRFKEDLTLQVERVKGRMLTASCEDLPIFFLAKTRDRLIEEIKSDLAGCWEVYVKGNDGKLTKDAIAFKQWLLENLECEDSPQTL